MIIDIANFYLVTPMEWYKCLKLRLCTFLAVIVLKYKLLDIATPDGSVYVEDAKFF